MKKMEKGKKFMIISICILVLAIAGSAYAYYQKVLFADLDVDAEIKGLDKYINYTKGQKLEGVLNLTSDYTDGLNTSITFYKKDNTYDIYGHIYLVVSSVSDSLKNHEALKYTVVNGSTVISSGHLTGISSDSSKLLAANIPLTTDSTNYTVYIWLDEGSIINYDIDGSNLEASIRCEATMKPIKSWYNGPTKDFYKIFIKTGTVTEGDGYTVDDVDKAQQLIKDPLGNIRYYGTGISNSGAEYKEPNNYIDIGDNTLWRIIGLFKDVELSDGTKKDLIKVIRSESIGDYSWDTSAYNVNSGYGINQWGPSTYKSDGSVYEGADLMRLLNPKPDGTSYTGINGSLYWNSQSGTCYGGRNNATISCDFTSTGLADEVKPKIAEVKWNLGGGSSSSIYSIYPNAALTMERATTVIASPSDGITRQTAWMGKIALPYSSDYGYATDLQECSKVLGNYGSSEKSYACRGNNWMWYTLTGATIASSFGSNVAWLLTPSSSYDSYAWDVYDGGNVNNYYSVYVGYGVLPVLYLSSETVIESGTGTAGDPYVLSD